MKTVHSPAATVAELLAEKMRQRQLKQESKDWKERQKALKQRQV